MTTAQASLTIDSDGRGLHEITDRVADWLAGQPAETGLLTLFCRHTSASLVIQENADPRVLVDLRAFFERVAPEDAGLYAHNSEGPDDMPAHIRSALTQTSLAIPVRGGRMALGTWQGIFLCEHRARGRKREIVLHFQGG